MKFIIHGAEVQMDLEDALRYVGVPLHLNANGYIRGRSLHGKWREYIHREIAGAKEGEQVDHINGDRLDNRRANLRIATQSQNNANQGLRADNKSGVKGVHFCKTRLRWVAQIKVNKKAILLGRYQTEAEAIAARLAGEQKYQGAFARQQDLCEKLTLRGVPA